MNKLLSFFLIFFTILLSLIILGINSTQLQSQPKAEKSDFKNSRFKAREKFYEDLLKQTQLSSSVKENAYDSLISLSVQQEKIEEACRWRFKKSNMLATTGKYSASFFEVKHTLQIIDSLELYKKAEFKEKKIDCIYSMARMTLNLGLYNQSVGYLYDILSMSNDPNRRVCSYSLLCLLFINMDKLQLADHYMDQAIKQMNLCKDSIDTITKFVFYNHYGGLLYTKKQYNEAIQAMEKAEMYAKVANKEEYILVVYLNLSNIYLSLDERNLSRDYLLNILKKCENEVTYMHALAAQNVAYIYFIEAKHTKALEYYERALDLARQIDAKKVISATLIEMSEVYKELGQYKIAWEYQKKGYVLKDSVMSAKAMEEVMIQTNNFEQKQEKLEKQILTQNLLVTKLKNRNKTIVLGILFFVLAMFIILLVYILRRLIEQKNNNKDLCQTLSSIENNAKIEVSSSAKKLNEDIDFKNRELTSTSLMLIEANEMISSLKTNVKKLKARQGNSSTKEIIDEMDFILNTHNIDQTWQEFKLYFEQVHPDFFMTLVNICPDLTKSEQRTCALIFLNLNTKEIAAITHRSIRTVETIIYQIRKKLNIPSEEKTLFFLQHILAKES